MVEIAVKKTGNVLKFDLDWVSVFSILLRNNS